MSSYSRFFARRGYRGGRWVFRAQQAEVSSRNTKAPSGSDRAPVFRSSKPTRGACCSTRRRGTLLIGISDDGQVLGLESDYHSLGGANRDKFEVHLRNLLNQQFGTGFVTSKVVIKFHEVGDKEVCQIETAPAKEPVIVTVKNKDGVASERFYARSGNSSQEIPLSDMNAYIKDRFRS